MTPADGQLLHQALAQLQAGQPGPALALLARMGPAAARHADANYLRALAHDGLGQPAEAIRHFQAATAAAPGNAGIWNSFGAVLDRQGDRAGAIAAWRAAVQAVPGAFEPWLNLANVLADGPDLAAARNALARCRALAPADARITAIAARLADAEGGPAAAEAVYAAALALRPDDAASRLGRAVALRRLGRPAEALAELRHTPATVESAVLRAHLLREVGQMDAAVAQYQAVLAAAPGHVDAQTSLALLLPQLGRGGQALDGFRAAVAGGATMPFWQAALAAASALKDTGQLGAWAAAARRQHGPALAWDLADMTAARLAGDWQAGLALARAACAAHGNAPASWQHRAWLALRCGELTEAETAALAATRLLPDHQTPWALLSLIWRLQGDAREAWLINYDRHVRAGMLDVPKGWANLPAFLADLAEVLNARHHASQAPAEQTLRGGTQTAGFLFDTSDAVLLAFRDAVLATVAGLLAGLAPAPDHPFLRRLTGRAGMANAWSVRLQSEGFHINHIHPEGWLSSAFYVALPPEVGAGDAGCIAFGQPEAELGLALSPRRVEVPEPGKLVIFPSYCWHGTIPFNSAQPRLTAAFDMLPA
ncbi:MAG: putative 2OG-Fe(II) oxygenase [Sphingomonadales bacterium]